MIHSVTKYLGADIPPDCVKVGFSVTTDSDGMEYTAVDWEAGPVGGGVSSASGDIFYASVDGSPTNPNYLWYQEVDLGLETGAWVNGTSTDLGDLADNLNALDSFELGPPDTTLTGVRPTPVPDGLRLELSPNVPNPFNPQTTIAYTLPARLHAQLVIYDVTGRAVARLVDEMQSPGRHVATWDGRDTRGVQVASGVYFARIDVDGLTASGKLLMLK